MDTGCSTTVVGAHLVGEVSGGRVITAFDGREIGCKGETFVK